jgi:hypothetical protein
MPNDPFGVVVVSGRSNKRMAESARLIPTAEGIRFLTRYDYRTRFGPFGMLFDRLIFRPLIGWATAWSFDKGVVLRNQSMPLSPSKPGLRRIQEAKLQTN